MSNTSIEFEIMTIVSKDVLAKYRSQQSFQQEALTIHELSEAKHASSTRSTAFLATELLRKPAASAFSCESAARLVAADIQKKVKVKTPPRYGETFLCCCSGLFSGNKPLHSMISASFSIINLTWKHAHSCSAHIGRERFFIVLESFQKLNKADFLRIFSGTEKSNHLIAHSRCNQESLQKFSFKFIIMNLCLIFFLQ